MDNQYTMEAFEFGRACMMITTNMMKVGLEPTVEWRRYFPRIIKHEIEKAQELDQILGLRTIAAVQQSICSRAWRTFFDEPVPWVEVDTDKPSVGKEEKMEISLMKEALKVSLTGDYKTAIAIFERNSTNASKNEEPIGDIETITENAKVMNPAASKVLPPPKPDSTSAEAVSRPHPKSANTTAEDWKSNEKIKGYVRLAGNLDGLVKLRCFQYQRPWHSKIRLPTEEDLFEGPDFYHFECHDLDCLIVVLRMLMSLDFAPKPEYATAAVMTCASHHFGMDRPADYQVKGMLAQKLFPELKNLNIANSINDLLPKMTFENLLKHPGIDKVIFGSPYFLLQHPQLVVINPALVTHIESVRDISSVDDMIVNQVNWDGCRDLSEVASEQSSYINLAAENGTKIHRRYCAIPLFVRVMFTPDKDHPRSFGDVQRFTLRAPSIKRLPHKVMEVLSDSTYLLRAVVKMDPQNPIKNPAEVRLYDVNAVMMLGDLRCHDVYRSVVEHKHRPDSGWKLGDPNFKFMLFYNVWEGEEYPTPLVTPMEYRPPDPIRSYELPQRNKFEDSAEDSDDSPASGNPPAIRTCTGSVEQ
ncbi:hypothetical protein EV127DRAFT_471581 [Xylaria flabelliformis]|nr:hypothetical protein EV127DRAFT_471581 [Xylaria flabelliformis]